MIWVVAWLLLGGSLEGAGTTAQILTRDEAVGLALANLPGIVSAKAATRQAQVNVRQNDARYLPTVGYAYLTERSMLDQTNKQVSPLSTVNPALAALFPRRQKSYTGLEQSSITLSQLLFDCQRTANQIRGARHEHRAAKHAEDSNVAQAIQSVQLAYTKVLLASRYLKIFQETTRARKELLDQVTTLFGAGMRVRFDVTSATTDYRSARISEVSAEATLAKARLEFNTALGIPYHVERPLVDDLDAPVRLRDPEAVIRLALDRRPESREAAARVKAAQANLRAAKARYLPRVTGNGTYTHDDETADTKDSWAVYVQVDLPIFDPGQTKLQVQQQEAALLQAKANLTGVQNAIVLDLREALIDVEESRARIEESRGYVEQAKENLELARQSYGSGMGRIIDVTNAQINSTIARQTLDRAKADLRDAISRVEKAGHLYPPAWFPRHRDEPPNPPAVDDEGPSKSSEPTVESVRVLGAVLSVSPASRTSDVAVSRKAPRKGSTSVAAQED